MTVGNIFHKSDAAADTSGHRLLQHFFMCATLKMIFVHASTDFFNNFLCVQIWKCFLFIMFLLNEQHTSWRRITFKRFHDQQNINDWKFYISMLLKNNSPAFKLSFSKLWFERIQIKKTLVCKIETLDYNRDKEVSQNQFF